MISLTPPPDISLFSPVSFFSRTAVPLRCLSRRGEFFSPTFLQGFISICPGPLPLCNPPVISLFVTRTPSGLVSLCHLNRSYPPFGFFCPGRSASEFFNAFLAVVFQKQNPPQKKPCYSFSRSSPVGRSRARVASDSKS